MEDGISGKHKANSTEKEMPPGSKPSFAAVIG